MSNVAVVPVKERIAALDVLRGFALFGVLLVNMLDFSGSGLRAETLGMRGSLIDQIVDVLVVIFAVTKFYLLFSFLFGVGFAVQMRRMEASGRPFVGFYLRRLVVLLMIGLLHSILLWDGDILRLYAVAGVLLLLVRRLPTRLLLMLAGTVLLAGLVYFGTLDPNQPYSELMGSDFSVFTNNNYLALVDFRLNAPIVFDIQILMVGVMFLVGLVVGREGLLDSPERYQGFLRRWWRPALMIGLVGNLGMLWGFVEGNMWLVSAGVHIGAPALSFVYVAGVLLNVEKLRFLAPVGQLALSNYLTHSLVFTTLFYGYGLGLYDQLSPVVCVTLVIAFYSLQIVISSWWSRRFRFGPMEWLWRSLSYGEVQTLTRQTANPS